MNTESETSSDAVAPKYHRSLSVRPSDLVEAQVLARRLRVKQNDLLGILLRAWEHLPPDQQYACITSDPATMQPI